MYPYLMLFAGFSLLGLAIYAWWQGEKPSVRSFALLMGSSGVWVTSIAGWSLSPSPEVALFWFRFQFIGVAAIPVIWLTYALQFAGHTASLSRQQYVMLWVIPFLTVAFTLTPAFDLLMFERVIFTSSKGIMVLSSWVAQPWFFVHSAYSFSIVAVSMLLMLYNAYHSYGIFRRQIFTLLSVLGIVVLLTLLNTLQILPPDQLITPLGFVLAGVAVAWSILRNRMINVVPIAREILIEQMDDGMLVVDEQGYVVDVNPAMQSLLHLPRSRLVGMSLDRALTNHTALQYAINEAYHGHAEVEITTEGGDSQHYDVRVRHLASPHGRLGRIIVLHNISRLKQIQHELFALATTDMLTGLYNRHQFFEIARAQVELMSRQRAPLSLLLFDIDYFKRINDTYGHDVGDQVLVEIARRIAHAIRGADIFCRYGGEEFVVLLPNTDHGEAHVVAERIRLSVSHAPIVLSDAILLVTISIGLATQGENTPIELRELLRQADQAMYRAKRSGRNRVEAFADGAARVPSW